MFSCTQAAGSCDAGVRPGTFPGNSKYEVDEACFRQCYTTCDYRRSHVNGWAGNCQNDCEKKCNRCNKYVWDNLQKDPRCPPPKCLLKNEAWNACLEDPKVGDRRQYFERAVKILTSKGIYKKYPYKLTRNIRYYYCRCKTQDSSEDGCQYFPRPMKSRQLRRVWKQEDWTNRWSNNMDEAEHDHNVGDSYWANRWLNNLDEAEADQNVGDSYWANRWLNNLDETDDLNGVASLDNIRPQWQRPVWRRIGLNGV